MRYSILFSFVFCLCWMANGQPVPCSPVTDKVISEAKQFSSQYQYSTVVTDVTFYATALSVAMWWTPNVTDNSIKFALMTGENGFIGFGFNTQAAMVGTIATITYDNTVKLYNLTDQSAKGVNLLPNQDGLSDITVQTIDGWLFSQFTWKLNFYDIKQPIYYVWSSRNDPSKDLTYQHDSQGANQLNFADPTGIAPIQYVQCGYGSSGGYFSFIGDPKANCVCPPTFTVESNCTLSNLRFNHTFRDRAGDMIATFYWTLDTETNVLDGLVQSISGIGSGWTSIAFSDPAGDMGPSDAILYPDTALKVSPLFLIKEGEYDTHARFSLVPNSNVGLPGSINFFTFQRNLSDTIAISSGAVVSDVTEVPMIAATCTTKDFPSIHDRYSYGADILNLLTGKAKPSPFVWNKKVSHGLVMWLAWGIIIPCGFLWARFIKGYPNDKSALWFEGHRTLMSIGFILVIVSGIYIVGLVNDHLDSTHKILGATVLACALYQVMSAVMRPHADPTNPSPQRLVFEWTHHIIGRSTIIISWVTIAYGLMLVNGISMSVVWGHVALSVIWLVAAFVLEIRKYLSTRRAREYESLNRR